MRESKTIFILEDNLFYANLLGTRLEDLGYETIEIFSSIEDLMNQIHRQPYMVLLDHNLPDGSGLETLKEIKSTYPYVHCIMISGQATIGVAIDSLKHGAFDYLLKGKDDNSDKLGIVMKECAQLHKPTKEGSKSLLSTFKNFFL